MITLDKVASKEYREQLGQLAEDGKWAGSGERYAPEVWWLATRFRARTILDYGSGPGKLKAALKHHPVDVFEFDPGIKGKDAMPGPCDIVACTDVLEHVEPDRLKFVLQHIHKLTQKAAFLVIATRPAEKRLPDGRNAHLIIDTAPWWFEKLSELKWEVNVHRYTMVDKDNAYFWTQK